MNLSFAGAVLDVAVADLERAVVFYAHLFGRGPDLAPRADQREWRMAAQPEIVVRLTLRGDAAGTTPLSLGVDDLTAELSRLAPVWADLDEPAITPGVIATLRLKDPDANTVVLWQDLMGPRGR